jgi:hypothetical protein
MIALTCLTAIAIIWYTYFTWQTLEQARQTAEDDADRLRAERKQHQDAVHTQISTTAFKLRRELRAMLDHADIKDAATIGIWAKAATLGFPVTEAEILQLMSLAPEASNKTQTALQEAYVTYYASAGKISALAGPVGAPPQLRP